VDTWKWGLYIKIYDATCAERVNTCALNKSRCTLLPICKLVPSAQIKREIPATVGLLSDRWSQFSPQRELQAKIMYMHSLLDELVDMMENFE